MHELCTPILYAYPLLVTSIFVWEIHQDSSGFIISWYDCVLADIHFIYSIIIYFKLDFLIYISMNTKINWKWAIVHYSLYIKVTDEHLVSYMRGTRSDMRSLKIKYQTPKNQISHHKQK